MNQDRKTNKKKILNLYLILGACILIIAAVTVTVILTVNNNRGITLDEGTNNIIDSNNGNDDGDNNNDGNSGDDNNDDSNTSGNIGNDVSGSDNSGDTSTNVSAKYEFVTPIENVDLINSYTFYKNNTLDCYYLHRGLDFAADEGTQVFACLAGKIESITTSDLLDGTVITIAHDNGLKSIYKFIDAKETLKEGDRVASGEVIGTVAQANGCEYKDGAHLHFEVYAEGKTTDPEKYLDISAK
jgi:murein DD-endopeptidase MepM/ murein hydrolase activator NlpD